MEVKMVSGVLVAIGELATSALVEVVAYNFPFQSSSAGIAGNSSQQENQGRKARTRE
jgi:hypothetical protein